MDDDDWDGDLYYDNDKHDLSWLTKETAWSVAVMAAVALMSLLMFIVPAFVGK